MSAAKKDTRREDPPALRSALALLGRGLWPVPITAPTDPVKNPGKQPIGDAWGRSRHTEETLRALFLANPAAGIGLKLGKDGGVIDIEVDDPESGESTLADLFGGEVESLETVGWESDRGRHLLYRWTPRLTRYKAILKGDWLPGLEVRIGANESGGKQYQSVCPPSPTDSGRARKWNGHPEILDLPDSFFVYLESHIPRARSRGPTRRPRILKFTGSPPPGSWDADDVAEALRDHYLDLAREWGVRFTGKVFDGDWAECHAIDREDRTPSAGLNLQSGVYHDFGSESPALSFFNFAITLGAFPDFPTAVNSLGHRFGVEPVPFSPNGSTPKTPLTPKGGAYGVNGVNGVPQDEEHEPPIVVRKWPDPPAREAWHGLAGRIVGAIDPHTESDPVAVLIQFLAALGNLIGRKACWTAEADVHYLNLFACIVGLSSKGRKGTSWATVRWLLESCDVDWARDHVLGGLVSGEGMIWSVRDPIFKQAPIKEKGRIVDYQDEMVDAGVADKRALFLESEMGRVLKVMGREGNTLSDLIRQAWETGNLRSATKNNPARATDAHISIVGHITTSEAARYLTETEAGNGFGNRFLWACVKRSKVLPRGGQFPRDEFTGLLDELDAAVANVRDLATACEGGRITLRRDPDAEAYWESVYGALSEGKPGLLGSIVGRGEAQVMRLACLYALLDRRILIEPDHLDAALALWKYCEDSACYVFGDALGDRDADHLLSALRSHPGGLTRTQIRSDVFGRNKSADEIARIIGRLLEFGRVRSEEDPDTGGRPRTLWFAVDRPTP